MEVPAQVGGVCPSQYSSGPCIALAPVLEKVGGGSDRVGARTVGSFLQLFEHVSCSFLLFNMLAE